MTDVNETWPPATRLQVGTEDRSDVVHTTDPDLSRAAEIRAELRRVLGSAQFNASERNRRFLEYVVEETLAGRGTRIKAYNIATEVFGRDVNFDPQLDPVVRMEARRLRRSLERFYLIDRNNGQVRLAMPKGGYAPEFQNPLRSPFANGTARSALSESPGTERTVGIVVAPFDAGGDQSIFQHFNRGFAEQVIIGLTSFPDIFVFEQNPVLQHPSIAADDQHQTEPKAEFVLTGSTALFAGSLNVKAILLHARTGRVLWGQTFERDFQSAKILSVRDEVASLLACTLAQPYGVIMACKAKVTETKDSRFLSPLDCIGKFYEYRRAYKRDLYASARECLERTVIANPDYAEAFACLSHLCTDGHRFGFAPAESPSGLRKQAAEFAQRAIELSPDSSRGHHAQGLAHWFAHDVPASLKAMRTALALNPNSTEVMTDLGLIWSLLGEWSSGIPLLEEASARQPLPLGTNRVGLSLYHFMNERYEDALAQAIEVDMPDVTHGFVAQAISLVRLGRTEEAARAVRRVVELTPSLGRGVLAELAGVNANPAVADRVLAAMREAGLPKEVTRH